MRSRALPVLLAMIFCSFARAQTVTPPALARGVNISHWFWLSRDPGPAGATPFIDDSDVRLLKEAGISHVRIPVEPEYLWDSGAHALRPENLQRFLAGISMFTGKGIAVVVDPHPARSPWALPTDQKFATEFSLFWSALAASLAATDPALVYLEILNEPHDLADKDAWPRLQTKLVRVVRAAAPRHTIIATGDEYSSIDALARLAPVDDANVVYTFHFYEPHTFTHQGATWGAPNWKNLHNVPYPAAPNLVTDALAATTDERARGEIRWYAEQRWNAAKVRETIGRAAAWAESHHAKIWCGEFGAYREMTPDDARNAWLRDVTAAMKDLGIGWCMWDYAGGFALVAGEPGARRLHEDTAHSIGLEQVGQDRAPR